MFRSTVVFANIAAGSGAALCALIHALSFFDVVPGFLVRLFAATVLAVFPFGGFTIFLALRVGRTYGVSGVDLSAFIAQRAPRWQRHVGIVALVYASIHLVLVAFGAVGAQKSTGPTHVPFVLSAFVVWFYLWFMQVFTVGLRDPKIVEPKARRSDQARA